MEKKLIIVRGGGDLATGVIQSLHRAGFLVLVLETENPSAIRRQVALCEAVYTGTATVEDVTGRLCHNSSEIEEAWKDDVVPIVIDPKGTYIDRYRPVAVIDAILAKRNLGTAQSMAPCTIALGPGFVAGKDVDIVIETKRGHRLGQLITDGPAIANTGIPGVIAGFSTERVIHSACAGYLYGLVRIGDAVEVGQAMAVIVEELLPEGFAATPSMGTVVTASLTGFVRGLIRDGYPVTKGFKIADIDPRQEERMNCFTVSDKARCLGGSALTALLYLLRRL